MARRFAQLEATVNVDGVSPSTLPIEHDSTPGAIYKALLDVLNKSDRAARTRSGTPTPEGRWPNLGRILGIDEVRVGPEGTLEGYAYLAEMINPALQLAALGTLTLAVGVATVRLGLDRGLPRFHLGERRCPSCGRPLRTRVCPWCAGKTGGRLQPARARKGAA